MTDLREKQPPVREFAQMPAANFEVEIAAWPYSSIKSEDVMSRKLVYRIHADDFLAASRFATVLRDTVSAIHDIWVSKITSIREI